MRAALDAAKATLASAALVAAYVLASALVVELLHRSFPW